MHYSIDSYVTKALPVKYRITAHSPFILAAKTRFVTLPSTKVLNSSEKSSWLQKRVLHGVVPHN